MSLTEHQFDIERLREAIRYQLFSPELTYPVNGAVLNALRNNPPDGKLSVFTHPFPTRTGSIAVLRVVPETKGLMIQLMNPPNETMTAEYTTSLLRITCNGVRRFLQGIPDERREEIQSTPAGYIRDHTETE